MMYSAYKLNKKGDNTQPWSTLFPIWNQSVVLCPVLTVASWPCIQVSQETGQMVWYSYPFQNFPHFVVIHTVKGFGIVNKAEIDVLLELSYFFDNPADVGNLISGSSAFSKISLNIWKFTVHVLLKPGLENFEHYFTSMWDECNCVVVRAFFGIAFLGDWNENWPFPVLWPLLSFPDLFFKKIRDSKGTFHAKMGSIKDRNGMDLTEAEDIKNMWQKKKKRCGKNTQKNYTKKIFMTQIITMVWSLTYSQTSWNVKSSGH